MSEHEVDAGLARGSAGEAQAWFDRELALEARGHLYAREAAANAWYAKGAWWLASPSRGWAVIR